MDVFLNAQTVFFLPTVTDDILREERSEDEQVEAIGPGGTIPGTMDDYRKLFLRCRLAIAFGFDSETVRARWQMGEGYLIHTRLQTVVGLTVDAI